MARRTHTQFLSTGWAARSRIGASRHIRLALVCVASLCGAPAFAQFGPEQPISSGGAPVNCLEAADLDNDGDVDVLATCSYGTTLSWQANLGQGVFGAALPFPNLPVSADQVRALDYDNDGYLDVVASIDNYSPPLGQQLAIALYRNDGTGTFQAKPGESVSTDVDGLNVADFENDGDPDVFYSLWSDAIYVKKSTGSFTLAPAQFLTSQSLGVRDIYAADLDGDGDADLAVASYYENQVCWYRNLGGSGPFSSKLMLNAQAVGAVRVHAADLDGDGDLEVMSMSASGNTKELCTYENLGSAFAAPIVVSTVGASGNELYGIDLDGDADNDLLVGEAAGVSWYPNGGSGDFGSHIPIMSGSAVLTSLVGADLDGDSERDALFTAHDATTVRIVWQRNTWPSSWTNLGSGLAGAAGVPSLSGAGALIAGLPGSLKLAGAAPSAPVVLLLSFSSSPTPFLCGTLLPIPAAALFPLATDANGAVTLAWPSWPAGTSTISFYLQYVIGDATSPCGVAISNALNAVVP